MIAEGLVKKARGMVAGSYKRVDDKDIKLSPTELYEIQNILRPSNDDRDIVPEATIDNLDVDVINQIIATAHVRNSKAVRGDADRAEILRRLNITDSNGDVRMAGLLVAGDYPQMFFPKLVVDVASYPDTSKSAPGKPRFLDRKNCEGPLTQSWMEPAGTTSRRSPVRCCAGRLPTRWSTASTMRRSRVRRFPLRFTPIVS